MTPAEPSTTSPLVKKPRPWRRRIGWTLLVLAAVLGIGRLCMPSALRWYVNRTLARSPLYQGRIGDISVHLWRGAYTIHDIKLSKTTGNIPVPFFAARDLDLAIEWSALAHGTIVGRVSVDQPELNFVDAADKAESENGGGSSAPWLGVIRDLFPFKINSARITKGSIHFRTFQGDTPVDVYLSQLDAQLDNLTNIQNDVTPLITTCSATGLAMDQAKFEYQMKLDPFSFQPTFQMQLRLLGLDVTKLNDLARHYGSIDFEHGMFYLVVELRANEGQLEGYVKPLFRNLAVLGPKDFKEDNPLQVFWEAVVGVTVKVVENQPRDQLGTLIPFKGSVNGPSPDILGTIGNVLRNAFIRAYLPKLQNGQQIEGLQFEPASLDEPATMLD